MARALAAADFRQPDRPVFTGQPVVARLSSGLAEAISRGLTGIRSAPWQVNADGVSEVAGSQGAEQDTAILRFESERGSLTARLTMDRQAISALLEAAMGGTGAEPAYAMIERPLSKIERSVLRLIHLGIGKEIAAMLTGMMLRPFSLFQGGETPEPDARGGLVRLRFGVNVFSYSGDVLLSFARDELERQVAAADDKQDQAAATSHKEMLQREVGKSEVTLTIALGQEQLALATIADLSPGKLVALTATAQSPVIVWSGDVAAYEATLGRSGDRLVVTINAVKG